MANGHDIIIKGGGSVDLEFDDTLYLKQGTTKIHKSANDKITRITVVDDEGNTRYDSGTVASGINWEVKAHCR